LCHEQSGTLPKLVHLFARSASNAASELISTRETLLVFFLFAWRSRDAFALLELPTSLGCLYHEYSESLASFWQAAWLRSSSNHGSVLTACGLLHATFPPADLSGRPRSRERLWDKLKVELNPYFIYQRTAKTRTGYREREREGRGLSVSRVLNLKVKPPPLLPNPRAEREGCSASTEPFNRFK